MKKILLFILFFNSITAFSQDGSVDQTFNVGLGADQNVYIMKQLSNGKIIVGGQFMDYGGTGRRNLVRLNADGTIDQTFISPADLPEFALMTEAYEDNGKLIVAGPFNIYNGVYSPGIVRLNSDGSVDPSFNPGSGPAIGYSGITQISRQNDKYIVTGNFHSFNGLQCGNIARLNLDGSLDETFSSFSSNAGFNNTITAHEILADGKILIAGNFTTHNDVPMGGIARLNPDGTVDMAFNPVSGANNIITAIAVQPDGKYIISGRFSRFNNVDKLLIARINPDGTLDDTLSRSPDYGLVAASLLLQPDGKIIAAGALTTLAMAQKYIMRLNQDGAIDQNFDSDIDNMVNVVSFQNDGKILAGGWFGYAGTQEVSRVARLNNNGFLATKEFSSDAVISLNPIVNKSYIYFDHIGNYNITVFDLSGKKLQSNSEKATKAMTIDFSDYQKGIYFLKIESPNGVLTKKIIKN